MEGNKKIAGFLLAAAGALTLLAGLGALRGI